MPMIGQVVAGLSFQAPSLAFPSTHAKMLLRLIVCLGLLRSAVAGPLPDPVAVREMMGRVTDYMLATEVAHKKDCGWERGAFFAGNMAHFHLTGNSTLADIATAWGAECVHLFAFGLGPRALVFGACCRQWARGTNRNQLLPPDTCDPSWWLWLAGTTGRRATTRRRSRSTQLPMTTSTSPLMPTSMLRSSKIPCAYPQAALCVPVLREHYITGREADCLRSPTAQRHGAGSRYLANAEKVIMELVERPAVDDYWWIDAFFMGYAAPRRGLAPACLERGSRAPATLSPAGLSVPPVDPSMHLGAAPPLTRRRSLGHGCSLPTFAALGNITGNPGYSRKMYQLYNNTAVNRTMWDADAGLFYRDQTYIGKLSPGGKKVFWARGNSWAIGGLTRALTWLPNDPNKADYLSKIRAMANALSKVQRPDGFWEASLIDLAECPFPETTGWWCGLRVQLQAADFDGTVSGSSSLLFITGHARYCRTYLRLGCRRQPWLA